MLPALIRFLFPKVCLYCREIHPDKGLLCERCLVGLDLLFPRGRCYSCFRESERRKCLVCFKQPSPWYQAGALFSSCSSGIVLLQDPDRFGKEIAAFFIIQYIRMRWPLPDAFYVDEDLNPISSYIGKFLPMKRVSKRREYGGKKILYFTKDAAECKIPEFLQGSRIYLLSYTHFEQ